VTDIANPADVEVTILSGEAQPLREVTADFIAVEEFYTVGQGSKASSEEMSKRCLPRAGEAGEPDREAVGHTQSFIGASFLHSPLPGRAADRFALNRNNPTTLVKRFGQRFKGSDNCYGCVAAPTRYVAISDARQKVAALFQDRISPCIRDRSPSLQDADPIVEAWGRVRVKVLPFGQFLVGEVIEPEGGGLADGKDAADLFWMAQAKLEDPDHARWVAEGCRDQVLTLPP
jgi:hypothetical protein